MGAAIVERLRDAMREERAGSGTKQVFFRHPAARQQRMPWHGLVGRCRFCFARTRPLAQGERARTGFWPGSRGRTCRVGTCNSRNKNTGHEVFNFADLAGRLYGYVRASEGRLNLERIDPAADNSDRLEELC